MPNIVGPHAQLMKNAALITVNHEALANVLPKKVCVECGSAFMPSVTVVSGDDYCGEACAIAHVGVTPSMTTADCKTCGREFTKRAPDSRYCSRVCHTQDMIERRPRQTQYGTCSHYTRQKTNYPSAYHAYSAMDDIADPGLTVYTCPCGGIHIGHPRPGQEYDDRALVARPGDYALWVLKMKTLSNLRCWGIAASMIAPSL